MSSPDPSLDNGQDEVSFKVVVIGEAGVGKTSIIQRYTKNNFKHNYLATVGVDFHVKNIKLDGKSVDLGIWDIAGQERFGALTVQYYRKTHGAFVVFDITDERTFNKVPKWVKDIREKVTLESGKHVPLILLANKSDLTPRPVSDERIDEIVKEFGFLAWFQVSARENTKIPEAMTLLARQMLVDANLTSNGNPSDDSAFKVDDFQPAPKETGGCCRS
eukprot:TRINITY_DN3883_c0_g3_i2.p1 TRINITY_DN3883_c0_g3~~TRINITY_DN3883_c0_g3_i2.p1  ORF type:complete len:218 (+),score=48.90 TRINITY_DN3883_c0_g3_i2:60-713(+)